eukprot:1680804-Heterocapsa_arctica.AAC.1
MKRARSLARALLLRLGRLAQTPEGRSGCGLVVKAKADHAHARAHAHAHTHTHTHLFAKLERLAQTLGQGKDWMG